MISFTIKDTKNFMSSFLSGDTFDAFLLVEGEVNSYCTFTVNGRSNKDFFDIEDTVLPFVSWSKVKSIFFDIIKGKKTPVKMKFILTMTRESTEKLIELSGTTIPSKDISSVFLNIKFENNIITCTTGVSLNTFTLDKSFEKYYDTEITKYLEKSFELKFD